MFNLNRFTYVKQDPETGGEGSGAGGVVESETSPSIEELQKQLESLKKDNESLLSKRDELLNETKAAKQKAKERQEAADKAAEEAARKNGDIDSLDKSWQEKLSKREGELLSQIEKYKSNAHKTNVESVARKIASDISVSPEAMLPHILNRLDMKENEDGSFKTVVKDATGNLSALTIDELASEFKSSDIFKPLIKGTQATGGGANGSKSSGKGFNSNKKFTEMTTSEKIAYLESKSS